ncbi:MAG: flagellar hook-associated protein FlgK [Candidatus Sericytochromatia bacterium]
MNIGMNAAVQALLAAQRALDVSGHNVANANTPGYSRQRIDLEPSAPFGSSGLHSRPAGPGQVGTGVTITQIKRIRDQFIDRQVRAESSPLGESRITADTMRQIEDIFGEPSDRSLGTLMGRFWDSWHALTTHPEDASHRANLTEVSVNLANVFQEINGKLESLRQDVNDRIQTTVEDVNSITTRIADLNRQIKAGIATGQNPNDLMDRRDTLLDDLSQKVQIHVVEVPSTGALNVYLQGQPLVDQEKAFPLAAQPILVTGFFQVDYPQTGEPANIAGGELKGLLDARNQLLSDANAGGFIYEINQLASSMMTEINAVHRTGFGLDGTTGLDFFFGTNATDIEVNPAIAQVTGGTILIAAASNDPGSLAGGPGDSGNAVRMAQLRNARVMNGNRFTFDDTYKGMLVSAGTQGQEAMRQLSTQEALLATVKERREQTSGVSTDEEMANVIKFQKAYAAAARILTTIDEMLERLMTVGVVGR